jgi:MFS family permease
MLALSTTTMAWIAGICLALYLGCIVYAIMAPQKQHDPQRGMAVGCLMFAAIPGVLLALLLGIGVIGGFETLVRVLFYVTALPAAYVLVLLMAQPIVKWRQNRHAWQPTADHEPQNPDPTHRESK